MYMCIYGVNMGSDNVAQATWRSRNPTTCIHTCVHTYMHIHICIIYICIYTHSMQVTVTASVVAAGWSHENYTSVFSGDVKTRLE